MWQNRNRELMLTALCVTVTLGGAIAFLLFAVLYLIEAAYAE